MSHFIEYIVSPDFPLEYFSYCSAYKRYQMNNIVGNNVQTREFQNDHDRGNLRPFNKNQFENDSIRISTILRNSVKDFKFTDLKE